MGIHCQCQDEEFPPLLFIVINDYINIISISILATIHVRAVNRDGDLLGGSTEVPTT